MMMANRFEILELERLAKENALQKVLIAILKGKDSQDLRALIEEELKKIEQPTGEAAD